MLINFSYISFLDGRIFLYICTSIALARTCASALLSVGVAVVEFLLIKDVWNPLLRVLLTSLCTVDLEGLTNIVDLISRIFFAELKELIV